MPHAESKRQGAAMLRAAKLSLYGNLLLLLIKAASLLFVESLAILTDLGITLVSLAVSVILYQAVKLSNRPADLLHNYGYGKVENVCEALEGVALTCLAVFMFFHAGMSLFHPKTVSLPWVGLTVSALSVLINFAGAWSILRLARQSKSPAIHAEGLHYQFEAFISLAIAVAFGISLLLAPLGLESASGYVDALATMLVSAFILYPSFRLARHAFFKLLDASIEEASQIEVLRQLGSWSDVFCNFHDLKTRSAGRAHFVEMRIVLPEDMLIGTGHRIAAGIEQDIGAAVHNCHVRVKMEPCDRDCYFARENKRCPYRFAPEQVEAVIARIRAAK